MNLKEAIYQRHSVRSYLPKIVTKETVEMLQQEIDRCNQQGDLHIQLVLNEPKAFKGIASYGQFKGVENYLVMAGRKASDLDRRVGYYGEQLVLMAQTLGLNSCWVGLTYKKVAHAFQLEADEKVACMIALGYGTTQGCSHKSKRIEEVSNCTAESPQWFREGVEAALLAPTAVNQQKFHFKLTDRQQDGKPIVEARRLFSLAGYTEMDLGIARLHFELGAGCDRFVWAKED